MMRDVFRMETKDGGVIRLAIWPEGLVLWVHGSIAWKSWQ